MTETTSTTDTDILDHFVGEGLKLVKADPETKGGVDKEWQKRTVSLAAIRRYLERGGGVGVQVGEVSQWLAVADADHEYAVATAPAFLPETLRQAKGDEISHYFLYCEGLGYEEFNDLGGRRLIDIKASNNGAGHLIVVEPTRHPTKGAYRFVGGFNPAAIAHVPLAELRRRVQLWACSSLIAVHLPKTREEGEGGRHDISKAIAGFGLRNGWTEEEALIVLTEAWTARRAPEKALKSLERNVADTARKIERNEPATGGRTLEELVPGLVSRIAKFMGWERTDRRELRQHYTRSDLGNAERFVDLFGNKVRWCPARKSWLFYDGARWRWDDCAHVVTLAHQAARAIHAEAAAEPDPAKQREISKFAVSSQNEGRISGMLSQAKPYLAVRMEDLDADRWVINCQNGTLDLRTNRLKAHDPADLITKIAPVEYDPAAECPRFKRFLKEVLVEDAVIAFVKRYAGYSATGITRERLFAILYGFGKNGKTTLVELLQDVLGDYATNTDTETILMRRYQGVGNDVAALKGARFVSAAEVEKGRRLAESKVKQLTGSDTVTARFLFGEPFNFRPEFKLWLSTNNKPVIQGTDDAIWDRIRLIPFTQRFEGSAADPKLSEKLRGELPGVFAWIVAGCLDWQEHGLGEPKSVAAATEQYRAEMDTLAAFLEDRCIVQKDLVAPATSLYKAYRFWCDSAGEKPETQKMFGMRLRERGFTNAKITSGPDKDRKGWFGLGLRADHPDPEDPEDPNEEPDKEPPGGPEGPLGGATADDGPLSETGHFAGKTSAGADGADDRGPKNQNPQGQKPHEEEDVEKRSAPSAPSAPSAKEHEQGDDALIAAGWEQRDRGDNSFWISPNNSFAYAREAALAELRRSGSGRRSA